MAWAAAKNGQREPWKAGFCDCFDNFSVCCLSFCFPCVQYGYNAEKIDGSSFCGACCLYACCCIGGAATLLVGLPPMAGCQCLIAGAKRTTLRHNYMLEESCCCDCCVHWCCAGCALSQEARELEIRGPPPPRQNMQTSPNIVIMNGGMPSPGGVMMTNMGYPGQPVPQGGAYMMGPNNTMVPAGNPQVGYAPQGYPPQQYAMAASPTNGYPTTPPGPVQMATSTDQPPSQFNYNQGGGQEGYSGGYTSGGTTTTTE